METSLTHFRTEVAAFLFLVANDYLAQMQDYKKTLSWKLEVVLTT